MRARHYDPNSGRFLQEDPIGTSDDINLYRYVKNNPLNFTDRDGLKGKPVVEKHDATILLQQDMIDGIKENRIMLLRNTAKKGGYNTKYRQDYRDLSFNPNTNEGCSGENYSASCVVYIDGKITATLPQIGNFLVGYNFNYAGFTLNNPYGQITNDIYQAGLFTEDVGKRGNIFQNPDLYNQAAQNERLDRPYYDAGFNYAEQEKRGHTNTLISDYLNF